MNRQLTTLFLVLTLLLANTSMTAAARPGVNPTATAVIAVATGYDHSCLLTELGGVKCWGDNSSGELGDGTRADRRSPVDVVGLSSGVTAIVAGGHFTCALVGGGAKCWGGGGLLGNGTANPSTVPVDVVTLGSGVAAISAGYWHACAVTTAGTVKCWGNNNSGKIGDGTTTAALSPVTVTGLSSGGMAVATGFDHTCALTISGVLCWGANGFGQLGDGSTTTRWTPVVVVGLATGIQRLTAGGDHSCASSDTGVQCWGNNTFGQLGNGSQASSSVPVTVSGALDSVQELSAGGFYDSGHTCAIVAGGALWCWGGNRYGQLGLGTVVSQATPAFVSTMSNVERVSASAYHTCATIPSGAWCWGANPNTELGDGTVTHRTVPADVHGLTSGVTGLGTGDWLSCALQNGSAMCWGNNRSFQLGQPYTQTVSAWPLTLSVANLTPGLATIDGRLDESCALVSDTVQCWTYGYASTLIAENATGLSSTYSHSCALVIGAVKCWGLNNNGQLGNGTTVSSGTPVDVIGLPGPASAIATGVSFSCAVVNTGAWCWGYNGQGQLGDNTTTQRASPTAVSGLASGVIRIVGGQNHACALLQTGGVKCWGGNGSGEVGDGTTQSRRTPVDVIGLPTGVIAVTAASDHTCALLSGGEVRCWGGNANGQLGDGTTANRSTPTMVQGLDAGVAVISAGGLNYAGHTCALLASGRLKCWGDNQFGQLGDGTPVMRALPGPVIGVSGQPEVAVNYATAQPGSLLRVVGVGFPANAAAIVTIDGQRVGTVWTDDQGAFVVFVSTQAAPLGVYQVGVSVNPSAETTFTLDAAAPLVLQEGSGPILPADPHYVLLPFVQR